MNFIVCPCYMRNGKLFEPLFCVWDILLIEVPNFSWISQWNLDSKCFHLQPQNLPKCGCSQEVSRWQVKGLSVWICELFLLRCLDHWGNGCVLQPVHHSDLHVPDEVEGMKIIVILSKIAQGMRSFPWTPTSASSGWAPPTWTSTTWSLGRPPWATMTPAGEIILLYIPLK